MTSGLFFLFWLYLLPSFFRSLFVSIFIFDSFPFRSQTNISDYCLENAKTNHFTRSFYLKVKYPQKERVSVARQVTNVQVHIASSVHEE
jgi:hypothetical protein